MPLSVKLLGKPVIRHEGTWHEPPSGLPSALLYYLAYQNAWVNRESLAFLFWSDIPEVNARKNLRNLILRIKDLPYAQGLEVERSRLRWQIDTDVKHFQRAVSENNFEQAIDLYKDELLSGFRLDNALEFSDWLELEREALRSSYHAAVIKQVDGLEASGQYAKAAEALETLREDDPFDEDVLRRQLLNLNSAQQGAQALKRFNHFKSSLDKEFGAEPERATLDLIEAIRKHQSAVTTAVKPSPVSSEPSLKKVDVLHNLPTLLTPFVGREIERRRIAEQLADPTCRLLTLVAPGGMGKTSLALAVAREQLEHFKDGVWFVPFAPVAEPEQMLYALGDALTFFPRRDAKAELLDYLKPKELLLVLDNLEHLTAGLSLFGELLETAPHIKLLATSREQLQLRAEWLFDVNGLSFPKGEGGAAETFDAVELFSQSAERIRADVFSEPHYLQFVTRICQLVEGMPLAIELAASWLQVLSLEEIIAELEQGIDLLEASLHDLPERHKSIRAVFDYSWQLLAPEQQRTLLALSVFRGSFERKAAQVIAEISTRGLLELVSKSLLRRQDSGRFDLHPLIRQYAEAKLDEQKVLKQNLLTKHGEYYLEYLHDLDNLRRNGREQEALDAMSEDSANIEAMWQWAVETLKLDALCQMSGALEKFFIQRTRFQEGIEVYQKALEQLDASQPDHHAAIGRLLTSQGWLYARTGQFEQAEQNVERAEALLSPLEPSSNQSEMLNLRGAILGMTGHYAESQTYFERAIAVAQSVGEERYAAYYLNNLAISEKELGHYERAEALYREALTLSKQLGEQVSSVRNLNNLALLLYTLGDLEAAKSYLGEGLAIADAMGFEQTRHHLLSSLGNVMYGLGEYEKARGYFEDALRLARKKQVKGHEASVLGALGMVATAQDDLEKARVFFHQGLELAREIKNTKTCMSILTEIAQFLAKQENFSLCARVLKLVLHHEATSSFTGGRAEKISEEYGPALSPAQITEVEGVALPALPDIVAEVLLCL